MSARTWTINSFRGQRACSTNRPYAPGFLLVPRAIGIVAALAAALVTASVAHALEAEHDLVNKLIAAGRFESAQSVADKALRLEDQNENPDVVEIAYWQNELGLISQARGRISEASAWFSRALRLRKITFGRHHPETAIVMNNLALMLARMGRHAEAYTLLTDSLRINRAHRGPLHSYTVTTISNLGLLNLTLGRYGAAERYLKDALARTVAHEGWVSQNTAIALSNLASLHVTLLEFDKARPLLNKALEIDIMRHGPKHPVVAVTLNNLGELSRLEGNYADAEHAYLRAVSMDLELLGPANSDYASDLVNLAALYQETGRLNDAHVALAKAQKIFINDAPVDPVTGSTLAADLARLLKQEGRLQEAELLYTKSLRLTSTAFGSHHPDTIPALTGLAQLSVEKGDDAQAMRYAGQALALAKSAFGQSSPQYARSALSHASFLVRLNLQPEASSWAIRSKFLIEKAFGNTSPDAARANLVLAQSELQSSRFSDAETHGLNALRLVKGLSSPYAFELAEAHDTVSRILSARHRWQAAFLHAESAFQIMSRRRTLAEDHFQSGKLHQAGNPDTVSVQLLKAAIGAATTSSMPERYVSTAFEAAEAIGTGNVSNALKLGAIKFHASNSRQAGLLTRHRDLVARAQALDRQVIELSISIHTGASERLSALGHRLGQMQRQIADADENLRKEMPAYATEFEGKRLSLSDAQKVLMDHELLVYILPTSEQTFVLAASNTSTKLYAAQVPAAKLQRQIANLRAQLDPTGWKSSFEPFDRNLAYAIFDELLSPLHELLSRSSTIYEVTSEPFQGLPLGILVTAPPRGGRSGDSSPDALRTTRWFVKSHSIVSLPTFSSLIRLRELGKKAAAPEPFLGVGAPDRSAGRKFADLPPLLAARRELQSLGALLRASLKDDSLLIGDEATEKAFSAAAPRNKRVIAFATHAISGTIQGQDSEPSLVLSQARGHDNQSDGFLTASEIASMDLRADWVLLSACNTVGDGAVATQSLVQGFFRAGAKSVLASHWPVSDRAAGKITTATLRHFLNSPHDGQANALRAAMIETMMDRSHPLNAHPATWGAFSLIGEAYPATSSSGSGANPH
ncbi:MAG: CHAT domain-containing tetratricopeptide repeat protein [Micropepsaceae bacterium]